MSSGDISSCCKVDVRVFKFPLVWVYECMKCGQECSLVNPENHKEEK